MNNKKRNEIVTDNEFITSISLKKGTDVLTSGYGIDSSLLMLSKKEIR